MKANQTNRRRFLAASLAGLAIVPLAQGQTDGKSGRSEMTGLFPAGGHPPDGYTPGILAEGQKLVFVSGRGPSDLKASLETQVRQTLQAIADVLKEADGTMDQVVMLRGYFTDLPAALPAYRKVRKEFFKKPYPASTSIGVAA